jgi:hypothetical protein
VDQIAADPHLCHKALLECNYLQGLEGECDSSHLSFLHREFTEAGRKRPFVLDSSPEYETEETDFGVRLIAIRKAGPDTQYVRVSSFVMPVSCWILARNRENHIYVPADDRHAWRYDLGFLSNRRATEEDAHRRAQIGPDYRRIRNGSNRYLQDRKMQKIINYTGIEDFLDHDACATESMGPVFDRTREHLGVSDKAVIAVRKFLINAVNGFRDGKEPPHIVRDPEKNISPTLTLSAQRCPPGFTGASTSSIWPRRERALS